jgi:hypothetical protein
MPLFAFFLWLFHSKKRWYYFDHGIFTLHYFSFLLLIILLLFLIDLLLDWDGNYWILDKLNLLIHFVGFGWMFYYFFLRTIVFMENRARYHSSKAWRCSGSTSFCSWSSCPYL